MVKIKKKRRKRMIELDYIVHSTSIDNQKEIASGWLNCELSDEGIQQAKNLNSILTKTNYIQVYSSDLKRASDTAKYGFGSLTDVIHDKRLRECNYGLFNGKPKSELNEKMNAYVEVPFPKGESYRDVEFRILEFIHDLTGKHKEGRVAVVSHQAPQLALEVLLKNKSWDEAIKTDWRKTGEWQAFWTYKINLYQNS